MNSGTDSDTEEERNNISEEDKIDRNSIKAELSTLSFEELQKLKEKIGAKVYKEAVFGKSQKSNQPKVFKRENKNRPREMSSKKPVRFLSDPVPKKQIAEVRDPRFDPLCGQYDKKQFVENYSFLSEVMSKDMKEIRAELKETTDPERQQQLRRLLQRLNDQHKMGKREKIEKEKLRQERQNKVNQIKQGKQPRFLNKSEKRVEDLVSQYEELKKEGSGRIQRHLKRRQQKIKKRSHNAPTGVSN